MKRKEDETVFPLTSIIYFLGILQAIMLFFSLYFRKKNSPANRLLAVLVVLMALILLNGYLDRINFFIVYPHLLLLTFPLNFFLGPVIYFYVGLLTRAFSGWRKMDVLHLIPALAVAAYLTPFYILPDYQKVMAMIGLEKTVNLLTLWIIASGVIYCLCAYFLLRRYQKTLGDFFSETGRINLNWLRLLLSVLFLLWGILLVEFLVSRNIHYTYMGVTLLIYIIGYFSLRQPEIAGFHFAPETEDALAVKTKLDFTPKNRYESEATPEKWQTLLDFMGREKPFLEPSLTLADLAEKLSCSPHLLSYMINARAERNFFHFINGYRVQEVKKKLADPQSERQDILSIAFSAGFSTKATFNAIFKQYTAMTPSQYRDSCRRNS